jgi:hypothetical protein
MNEFDALIQNAFPLPSIELSQGSNARSGDSAGCHREPHGTTFIM